MRVSKRLSAGFHRQGPNYRFDDQVDFDDIRDTFGSVSYTHLTLPTNREV